MVVIIYPENNRTYQNLVTIEKQKWEGKGLSTKLKRQCKGGNANTKFTISTPHTCLQASLAMVEPTLSPAN